MAIFSLKTITQIQSETPAGLAHREGPSGGFEQEFWQLSEEMEIKSIKDTF